MRFRTKIFAGWAILTIALWGGAFFAIRGSVEQSFNRMADETFSGIHRGLHQLYVERVSSMRQACQLVVNIPELRALIAEQNYELTEENQASLQERLDYVNEVTGATFVCALSASGAPVALNKQAVWRSAGELAGYLQRTPAASALVLRTFDPGESGPHGLWVCQGRLYEVAAVPLVFQEDGAGGAWQPEGGLLMGKQLTDAVAEELGRSYGCEITFLAEDAVAATSLAPALKQELLAQRDGASASWPVTSLGGDTYRTALEALVDPSSGQEIGAILIQQNQAHAKDFTWEVARKLILTILAGMAAAGVASFFLSLAIARPVRRLAAGVQDVAQGDLNVNFDVAGSAELAQLAGAFNHMVSRLRESRSEQERLLGEARKAAQREHLLHEVAQHINQRLDVQSSLTMFLHSAKNLFPDAQLTVFAYDSDASRFEAVCSEDLYDDREPLAGTPSLEDAALLERLAANELVYFPGAGSASTESGGASAAACSTCLAPLRVEQRLRGVITATRARADGFTADEREFLRTLADHFAIALANAQVYEELRQAYDDLRNNQKQTIQSERLRALGQMASGIAHDFNNHLTGVMAFLEMALDRDDLDPELRTWLEMGRESSVAAADVVKLLRNFYRRETSDAFEPVDLDKLVALTISLTRPRWFDMPREHGLDVRVCQELGNVGFVLGHAAEFRDALTNLLFNAVDALPRGGVIHVRTRRQGAEIVLEVQDNGAGMSDEVREQCLEPFFSTKGGQGTGLGLSMVHGFVQRHRGSMSIASELGLGTTIRLHFPAAGQSAAKAAEPITAGVPGSRKVLCVDDDPRVLKAVDGLLKQLGHDVATTRSGVDAIERAACESFDVVITDLGMPGMDGREVARNVKRVAPDTRVILLTGWADRLRVEDDLPEGVDQLLGKPVTKEQLQRALNKDLARVAVTAASSLAPA